MIPHRRRIGTMALGILAIADLATGQDFEASYILDVLRHPDAADPIAIVRINSWTGIGCSEGEPLVYGGWFEMQLSHPVVDYASAIIVDCALPSFGFNDACDSGGPARAYGVRIVDFAYIQGGGGIFLFDNPLHIMDVQITIDDLTPRNLELETISLRHVSGCLGGSGGVFAESPAVTKGSTIIRVNGGCPADFDGDGSLSIFDFLAFQNAFAAGDLAADLDGDGVLTLFDFLAFQNEFDAGCE
ncbi:MAG: hypothetical protein NCW75_10265 [Phycisphaera sp.]|nr:MAG: hypothetical protein NCW75_10265 [Phycisphaera sp.]